VGRWSPPQGPSGHGHRHGARRIAKDGGFPVSAAIVAESKNEAGEAGSFSMSVDVTSINDPDLKIEAPANVEAMPG